MQFAAVSVNDDDGAQVGNQATHTVTQRARTHRCRHTATIHKLTYTQAPNLTWRMRTFSAHSRTPAPHTNITHT